MKKLSKFIYFIFAFALITCMAIFNPAIEFASAETGETSGKSITISNSKVASTVEAGEDLIIPIPQTTAAEKYVVVTDRSGTQYTYDCQNKTTVDKNGDEIKVKQDDTEVPVKYFTLLNANKEDVTASGVADTNVAFIKVSAPGKGTYTVQYKVVDGNKTYYSDLKRVQVKSVAHSWEFNVANSAKNIIPSITAPNTKHVLPLPKIVNGLDDTKSIKYTVDDKGTYIKVTNSGVDVTNDVLTVEGEGDDAKLVFTPTLDGVTTDTYIIRYISQVTAFPDKTFTVNVDSEYNTEAELEVTHNAITNYQVGAVVTFPTANVTDKTHNKSNIEVNNKIVIKKGGDVYATLNDNQYSYTFTEAGTYTIQYEVTDAYGNTATSKSTSITLSDKKPYKATYADSYTVTTEAGTGEVTVGEVNTDIAYMIPNQVGYNGFWLPAIYGEDYVDGYKDLTFSRKLVSTADSSVYFDLDSNDATHGNGAYQSNQDKGLSYNDKIYFQFPETAEKTAKDYAGTTFKLVYTVKDKVNLSETKATEYTIKIADVEALTNNIDKNLKINFATINDEIDPSATLTFNTATAKEEPADSNLIADERIAVKTYYYYGAKTEIEGLLNSYITKLSATDDDYIEKYGYIFEDFLTEVDNADLAITELKSTSGKTDIKLTGYTNQEKVTIFAVAINDQNQFVIKAQEVAINNTINDVSAPIVDTVTNTISQQLSSIGTGVTAFNQNYEVTLPSVSFTDNDKSLQVDVKCYVDTPDQTVGITIDEFIKLATGECGIQTAKLTTTYAGTYYIVYTATDDAGNQATYISTFDVAKTEKAYIEVENGSNITKNVGDEVKLNINLAGEGEYTDVVTEVKWGENKPSGLGRLENSYKFDKAGTYVATITSSYKMNGVPYDAPSVTVTITVTEPEMEWASDVDEILTNRTANEGETIELPIISATENGVEINATPKVVFIDENDNETEVDIIFDQNTFNNYYFVAEKDGVYKVTYTATTAYNSEVKSFTVTCGDYYDPSITIANNKLQDSTITYNGTDIVVTTEFKQQKDENDDNITGKYTLTVVGKAGEKQVFSYDIDVDLKDTNAKEETNLFTPASWSFSLTGDSVTSNGTTNGVSKWTITGVGDYELKLTVKDANGNSETKSINFKVANKTEPKSIKDDVVGIVLIVVSVVLLGGVILFFALAGKRNKSKRVVRTNKD